VGLLERSRDLGFLGWLGVEVPPAVRKDLLAATDPARRLERSHALNLAIARRLLEEAEGAGSGPIGFCVEHVMLSNIEAGLTLVERVRQLCREFRSAPAAFAPAIAW